MPGVSLPGLLCECQRPGATLHQIYSTGNLQIQAPSHWPRHSPMQGLPSQQTLSYKLAFPSRDILNISQERNRRCYQGQSSDMLLPHMVTTHCAILPFYGLCSSVTVHYHPLAQMNLPRPSSLTLAAPCGPEKAIFLL